MNVILAPFSWTVEDPYLTLIPAMLLGACHFFGRRKFPTRSCGLFAVAAVFWILAGLYERWMILSGSYLKYNIRIDLVIICVLLYFLSIASVVAFFTVRRHPPNRVFHQA